MKYTQDTVNKRLMKVAEEKAVFRARDLEGQGVPRTYLARWVEEGRLERIGRGLYRLLQRPPSQHQSLIEAAKRVPNGVVCLLSALQFHELGTQLPYQVWIAVDRKAWKPRVADLPIRLVRFSGQASSA